MNTDLDEARQYADTMLEALDVMGRAMYFCLNHPNAPEFKAYRKLLIGAHERMGKDTTHFLAQIDEPEPSYFPTEEDLTQHEQIEPINNTPRRRGGWAR
jgi:hypothetical protein